MAKKNKNKNNNNGKPASNEAVAGAEVKKDDVQNPEVSSSEVKNSETEEAKNDEGSDTKSGSAEVSAKDMKETTEAVKTVEVDPKKEIDNESVTLTRKMKCYIGGKFYKFKAHQKYKVSASVKKVLIDRKVVKATY